MRQKQSLRRLLELYSRSGVRSIEFEVTYLEFVLAARAAYAANLLVLKIRNKLIGIIEKRF